MGSKGTVIAEEFHVVNALPPVDINGGATTTDWLNLKEHGHVTFIVQLGVTGAASTITVEEADDAAGLNNTAIAFSYYAEETAAGDTLGDRQDATTAGFASSTNDNIFYVIEIDASQLSDGSPYVAVVLSDPAVATVASVVAVLSGSRYGEDLSRTVLT